MVLFLFQHAFLPVPVWKLTIYHEQNWSQSSIFFLIFPKWLSNFGVNWGVDLFASLCTNQCQLYYTLEKPLPLGSLGLNAFNHPWKFQMSYIFPLPALIPLVLSKFLEEYVTNQFRLLILVAPCWMEAPQLPTLLIVLEDLSHWCPMVKDLITAVSVGKVLKGLPLLNLTLWLLRDMLQRQGFLSYQAVVVTTWASATKSTSSVGKNGQVSVLEMVCQIMPLWPSSSLQGFKSSYHLQINACFYYNTLLHVQFDPWDIVLFPLLQQMLFWFNLLSICNQHIFFRIMLLFLFLLLVVGWLDQASSSSTSYTCWISF